ncbi:arylsulfatase [Pseudomonas schmalbachii]|uniref:Arylsulfatase n=1 Tax=Pseudomonas schmalbachii TaxID=2816993 RepID=A0ABS3TK06_9PSED|nr:arylsulfatase [Pseudomonas schmalbachii]MBO3273991.1 arylsulfatase [Pseudomonas schmalbachii]
MFIQKKVRALGLLLGLCALAIQVHAETILPKPDYHYPGYVGRTKLDSDPPQFPPLERPPKGAPNVLVILLDDVGFGQFDVFGGAVPSPSLDKLAADGVRFNRFHTTALCSPTRAALLTGRNEHQANFGVISELGIGYDGYTGILPRSTGTIAEILRQNGYATAQIGKNHNTPPWETSEVGPFDRWPTGLGFDYFYGFNGGDTSQFEPILYEGHSLVPRSKDPNYHLTTDLADHAITWVNKAKAIDPQRPFFLYVAPGAAHSPHQPPADWRDKYKGQFDMGWDKYRELTLERQKKLGVVPANAQLTPRPADLAAWDSLQPDQKRLYSRMMELFAAFSAHTDYEMGRIIDAVRKLPDGDNTLIIYMVGDNGASAEGGMDGRTNEFSIFNGVQETWQSNLKVIDELGGPKHFNHFPSAWAHAMNTPFQWTKQVASHFGGTRNPLVISWPAKIKDKGGLRSQFAYVTDITPTILEAAGIEAPSVLNGVTQKPMDGISMLYTFNDAKARDRRRGQVFELFRNRGIYQDGWFASSIGSTPWNPDRDEFDVDKTTWELYKIDEDFSQAHDLAAQYPEKVRQMDQLWWAQAQKANILPLNWDGVKRFNAELMGRPSLAAGRKQFVYNGALAALPEGNSPGLHNRSFSVTAEVELPEKANGMLFTQGGFTGGWGFYLKDGHLTAVHNYLGMASYRVDSESVLPTGKTTLKMDFDYAGSAKERGKGGTLRLSADGKVIAEGKVERTVPFIYSLYEGQDVGLDSGSAVSGDYTPPFTFEGKLDRVTVDLR